MGLGVTGIVFQDIGGAGSDEELYGKKPIVPDYPDIGASQSASVAGNIATLPDAQKLAAGVNRFNQDQILEMLKRAVPGYDRINAGASNLLESEVRGEIPADVMNAVRTATAGRSLAGGFGGSGMSRNLEARDLGLTSFDIANKGLDSASRWISQARKVAAPEAFDVSNMFLSPAQRYAADVGKYQRDLYANTISAAPDPAKRGAFDTEMGFIGMALSAYSGGAGYTNSYHPDYGGGWNSSGSGQGNGGSSNGGFRAWGSYGNDSGTTINNSGGSGSDNAFGGYAGGQAGGWSGFI